MNINIREAEGGYYIKLSGRGRRNKDWITKNKKEVVRIVKKEFLRELSPDDMRVLEEMIKDKAKSGGLKNDKTKKREE